MRALHRAIVLRRAGDAGTSTAAGTAPAASAAADPGAGTAPAAGGCGLAASPDGGNETRRGDDRLAEEFLHGLADASRTDIADGWQHFAWLAHRPAGEDIPGVLTQDHHRAALGPVPGAQARHVVPGVSAARAGSSEGLQFRQHHVRDHRRMYQQRIRGPQQWATSASRCPPVTSTAYQSPRSCRSTQVSRSCLTASATAVSGD